MIAMADDKGSQEKLLNLCAKSPFGCKIAAYAVAYGFDKKFSYFWTDDEENAVYCMVDDVLIISGTVTNPVETQEFIKVIGVKEIMCAVRNSEVLGLKPAHFGDVIKKMAEPGDPETLSFDEISLREVYGLLEETGMTDEFESFYLDLSHKLRHQSALITAEYIDNDLAGCAVASSVTEGAAIISAVAVSPAHRRKGIGSRLIKKAERALRGKTIYIFKEKDKNNEFYRALGYGRQDTWVTALVKE